MNFVKTIQFDPTPKSSSTKKENKIKVEPPPKTKRVVAQPEAWEFAGVDLSNNEFQLGVLKELEKGEATVILSRKQYELVVHQIKNKLCGYRAQDAQKQILDNEKFIQYSKVIELFGECGLECYYCRQPVRIVYEYVREPRQWTLERKENTAGHNEDNVWIACLNCNLRRRTMRSEKYVMTKQMQFVKKV